MKLSNKIEGAQDIFSLYDLNLDGLNRGIFVENQTNLVGVDEWFILAPYETNSCFLLGDRAPLSTSLLCL